MPLSWSHPVVASLTPVFLLIALGYLAGRLRWVKPASVKDLSNLVFLLLIPALLFRTMGQVQLQDLDWRPLLAYYPAAFGVLFASIAWRGFTTHSIVRALSGVFSNMVMIGIPIIGLAYGQEGLVTHLTLVSVHALSILTVSAVLLELADARQQAQQGGKGVHPIKTALVAMKNALIHPIPLPIIAGLLYAQTGWGLAPVVDKPLQWLGSAFGPMALVMVGITLADLPLRGQWRMAWVLTACKNVLLPLAVGASAWAWGIRGLPLTVMVVAAGMPAGANVFLFAQRYRVGEDEATAAMGLSTAVAVFTLSALMALMAHIA